MVSVVSMIVTETEAATPAAVGVAVRAESNAKFVAESVPVVAVEALATTVASVLAVMSRIDEVALRCLCW